jgi:hypothetical protein
MMTNLDSSLRPRTAGLVPASVDHAMLVHDIRCALQSVTGGTAVLEEAQADAADLRVQLARIAEASQVLGELVDLLITPAPERASQAGQ